MESDDIRDERTPERWLKAQPLGLAVAAGMVILGGKKVVDAVKTAKAI